MITQSSHDPVRYIQKNNVEETYIDDEWILLNLDQYTVTKVNKVGGFFWSLLHQEQTVESLLRTIVAEYRLDSSYEILEKDIEDYLSELIRCGLIQDVH